MDGAGAERSGQSRQQDELAALAAVRRAAIHAPSSAEGATAAAIGDHLGLPARGSAARRLRATLVALERDGAVRRLRAHGRDLWQLAPPGARALAAAARSGRLPALPESPQHRAWREAREAGRRELPRLRALLRSELAAAERMLAALDGPAPEPSDAWLALGPGLHSACRRLGSAWHCLHEWPEPEEDRSQRDGPRPRDPLPATRAAVLRAGRRNVALWASRD